MGEARVQQGRPAEPQAVATKPKSSTRTFVLLGVLGLLLAAYAHDYYIAKPAAAKAYDDIQKLVDSRNALGVEDKEGGRVTSEAIQKEIGKAPSWTKKEKLYTLECYRYWGGMLPQRQYIIVMYVGDEPRRQHVHYLNGMPPEEDYPSEPTPVTNPDDKNAEGMPIEASPEDGKGDSSGEPGAVTPAESDSPDSPATTTDAPNSEEAPPSATEPAPESTPPTESPAEPATESPEPSAESADKSE